MAQLLSKEEKLKRKKAQKIQKCLDKEIDNHNLRDVSSSETEDVDFSKVIRPIGYFIDDREQMIEEMFSILKGEQLRKMLPPILKSYTLEELKADCLVHLLGMSRKRITAILEGRELSSSSDSETDSEDSLKESNKPEDIKNTNSVNVSSHSDDDALSISVSKKEMDFLTKDETRQKRPLKKRKLKLKADVVKQEPEYSIVITDSENDEEKKKVSKTHLKIVKKLKDKKRKKHKKHDDECTSESDLSDVSDADESDKKKIKESEEMVDKGKSLLEILELEMRARAIRALLKNTPNSEEPVPVSAVINIKPESSQTSVGGTSIGKTITEVIESTLQDKHDTSDGADVELVDDCNIDLCVIDDDDDDICIQKSLTPVIDITSPDKNTEKALSELESAVEEAVKPVVRGKDDTAKSAKSSAVSEPKNTAVGEPKNTAVSEPKNTAVSQPKITAVSEPKNTAVSEPKNTAIREPKNTAADSESGSKDNATWSERWAESKNVKEIVKNSKICANLRKRMRFARMLKQKQMQEDKSKSDVVVDFSNVEESSVAQYNLIKSLDKSKNVTVDDRDGPNNSSENVKSKENDETAVSSEIVDSGCLIIGSESEDLSLTS